MNRTLKVIAAVGAVGLMALTACSSASGSSGGSSAGSAAGEGAAFPVEGETIELIVPSAAGAGNDILARIIAPSLQEKLGANVEVINKEGGGQILGLSYIAESDPNGMTLGFTNIPSVLGRYLDPSKNATFTRSSFTPIGSFTSNTVGIFVKSDSPFQTFDDLSKAATAEPGVITTGTDSRAGDDHVNLLRLQEAAGQTYNIVHYNSGADKVASLVAGETQFAIGGVSSFYGQVQAGDVRALAVVADKESKFLPGVPTLKSLGVETPDMTSRFTLSVPAETAAAAVTAWEAALKATVEDPAIAQKLTDAATEPQFMNSADMIAMWTEREAETKPIIESLLAGG